MFSPLESFELYLYRPLSFFSLDVSLTNGILFLVLAGFFIVFFAFGVFRLFLIPTGVQIVAEQFYRFILLLVGDQTSWKGLAFFPMFFTVYTIVTLLNVFGLFPFAYTVTAHFAVTLALAFSFNFAFMLMGFRLHGIKFMQLFFPAGAPRVLVPLIFFIELASYLIRTFSLSIRLFANMMAGHTLLHILATFTIQLLKVGGLVGLIAALGPLILVFAVFFLELGIALIQAYVFTVLLAIYLNDSYHPVH